MYGILIGFTCKTWHCLYKIQCIGINKGTEQQTLTLTQTHDRRKGNRVRERESFFLCRFWCQERACAAAYQKICERPWAANSSAVLASQFSNHFLFMLLLLCVCVCSLPLIANAWEMESALEHKTPTVVETVELHKYFYFYFYFYDAARSDNNKKKTNQKIATITTKTRNSKKRKKERSEQ